MSELFELCSFGCSFSGELILSLITKPKYDPDISEIRTFEKVWQFMSSLNRVVLVSI